MSKTYTDAQKERFATEGIKERTVLNLTGIDAIGAIFSSGSVGYRPLDKVTINDARFQITGNIVKIGTKPTDGKDFVKPVNGEAVEYLESKGIKTRTVVDLKDVEAVATMSEKSGSVGYFIYGKTTIGEDRYQLSVRATKIGSRTDK